MANEKKEPKQTKEVPATETLSGLKPKAESKAEHKCLTDKQKASLEGLSEHLFGCFKKSSNPSERASLQQWKSLIDLLRS